MARLRLLVATHEYSLTGAPIALYHLVSGLAARWEILVASPADGPLRGHFLSRQINAIVVPHLDTDIAMSSALLLSFDAVLGNTLLSFPSIHAAHAQRKPSVWYIHEGHSANQIAKNHGPGVSAAFSLVSRAVVPSEFSRRFFAPARPDIQVVPYGIEARETSAPSALGRPFKILQLGSIEPRKGQDVACAAMRMMRESNIELDIVGSVLLDGYYQELRAYCADLPRVRFFPAVDTSQTAARIAACDAVVVPSRDEVTPMVILEAMAQKKPVIASAVGGIPEMIVDGKTGFLFEPQNAQQLAAIIHRIATDHPLLHEVSTAAQNFVRSHRTLDQFRNAFAAILSALLPG